jgi:hypothetical protein
MSQAKKRKTKQTKGTSELPVLRPNAAGIDIGATEIETVAMESTGVYFALSSALIGRVQVPPALG